MLKSQKEMLSFLQEARRLLSGSSLDLRQLEALEEQVVDIELLVPMVGAFSAGKSTLINKLLGHELLPVGIAPETELATELRFSSEERVEAVFLSGDVVRYELPDMASVKQQTGELSHLRLYVNSKALEEIAPLVLVDMPGFDSTLANHNKAIARYFDRGVHYLVVSSVESGAITRSLAGQIEVVQALGRGFSFFVTKSNLRSPEEVQEIVEEVTDHLDVLVGETVSVHTVGDADASAVARELQVMDPEALFRSVFLSPVKDQYLDLVDNINLAMSGLRNQAGENEACLEEAKASLFQIEQKRDRALAELQNQHYAQAIGRCVKAVEQTLHGAIDELTDLATQGNAVALERAVVERIRPVLLREIQVEMQRFAEEMIDGFRIELRGFDQVLSGSFVDSGWLDGFSDRVKQGLEGFGSMWKSWNEDLQENKKGRETVYKTVATVVAVATNIAAPVIELLIIFLPDLLSGLFAGRQREQVRNRLLTEMIPTINQRLRKDLAVMFEQRVAELVNTVAAEFEKGIQDKQQLLEKIQQEKEQEGAEVEARATELADTLSAFRQLATETLYKEV